MGRKLFGDKGLNKKAFADADSSRLIIINDSGSGLVFDTDANTAGHFCAA
ncbi:MULTISPECIES: hypothetical protein [Pantoea]|nr:MULTISPECIES: hypothetical protein [Pantoea]